MELKYEKGCDGIHMAGNEMLNKCNCYYGFALEQGGRCTHPNDVAVIVWPGESESRELRTCF